MDKELKEWINKSLNETITDEEARALEERLLRDYSARDQYLNAVNLHASLCRRFSAGVESSASTYVETFPDSNRRVFFLGLAAAVALAFIVGVAVILLPPKPIAVVAQVIGAYGGEGEAFTIGEKVGSGRLEVSRGLLRLDFLNGALVTVEGPAEMEVSDGMHVVLHRGVVTATIPESAVGFVVDTAAAHVVDLGTSFGVSVSAEGLTEVCVFEEVEVSNSMESLPRILREGEAVRTSEGSSTIDDVAYETSRFENAWPVTSGVLQTTGSMRFVSPGPDFHPGNFEDNEHIVVFPEKRGFEPGNLSVWTWSILENMPRPATGKTNFANRAAPNELPPSARCLSRRGKSQPPAERVRGQITFTKPIVGIITMDRLLKESESVFGIPNVAYPSARMIEPRPEGDERPGLTASFSRPTDAPCSSSCRRTPGHLDQVRVLVEAE